MVDLDSNQPSDPSGDFAASVDDYLPVFGYRSVTIQDKRISDGESFFKVWREHFKKTQKEMAKAIGVHIDTYRMFEENEEDVRPDIQDVLNFCRYLDLHPDDLSGCKPPHLEVIGALIAVYDDPSLLSSGVKNSPDLAYQVLCGCASDRSFKELNQMRVAFERENLPEQAMIVRFLNELLARDGRLSVSPKTLFKQAEDAVDLSDQEQERLESIRERFSEEHEKTYSSLSFFSQLLYPYNSEDVEARLLGLLEFLYVENAAKRYFEDPEFIGMKEFPDQEDYAYVGDRSYSWRELQAQHFECAHLNILAWQEYCRLDEMLEQFEATNYFDTWVASFWEVLARYENRQAILQHPDFSHLKRDYRGAEKAAKRGVDDLKKRFETLHP